MRCIKHHKTLEDKPSLTGVGMSLNQVKYTYSCLPALIIEAAKNAATLLLSAKQLRCTNCPSNSPANQPSLTGVGMSLDQVKYIYPCLPALIMAEHWLKQAKMLPCYTAVEQQRIMMHQPPHQYSCKSTFPNWSRNELQLSKIYLFMSTSLYYDRTLAKAGTNAALTHCF